MTATSGTALVDENEELKRRDAEIYDELPEQYTEYVHRISHYIIDEICEHAGLQPGERVLDVGSGTGMATAQAAEYVGPDGHVLGIDHSRGLVEVARRGAPLGLPIESLPLSYEVMDAENLELDDASFDVVLSFSAIFHFPNPQRAVDEMFRVTRPGGRLVLSYTAIRPIELGARIRHLLQRLRMKLLPPPVLFAPEGLSTLADRFLPPLELTAEPEWSLHRPGKRIHEMLAKAGYRVTRETFAGRDVAFSSADEFYEAQLMISSDLRTRAARSSELKVRAMRDEFLAAANRVLARGGRLLYPFGAVVISAERPG